MAGSLKPWEAEDYKNCIDRIVYEKRENSYCFLAEYFEDGKEYRKIKESLGISLIRLPGELNPFQIKRTEFQFFEAFL